MPDYREFNPKERRYRSIRRSIRRFATLAVTVVMILGVSAAITAVIEAPEKRAAAALLAQSKAELLALEQATQGAGQANAAALGPIRQEAGAQVLLPITGSLITLPQNGRVDMNYFKDALFIGDSLTHGFEFYPTGIKEAKYAAYIGVGPRQLISGKVKKEDGSSVVAMDEIVAANASKVYILLGTNSLNSADTDEAIIKYYNNFLDALSEKLPKATVYYIQGMPPVTAAKALEKGFDNERIRGLNEQIAKMAFKRGYHYLDLNGALKDDAGALRADLAAGDGLHMNDVGYGVWKEYLITHTAYSKKSPYIPGSPFYLG